MSGIESSCCPRLIFAAGGKNIYFSAGRSSNLSERNGSGAERSFNHP